MRSAAPAQTDADRAMVEAFATIVAAAALRRLATISNAQKGSRPEHPERLGFDGDSSKRNGKVKR